uniref:Uncharacterized protein n=1 Tax=Mycena chlorophos TaxID=658473 RepID=A0ABQ0KX28_MYCCL|nr:predicted protein [Mycena chlorophos]
MSFGRMAPTPFQPGYQPPPPPSDHSLRPLPRPAWSPLAPDDFSALRSRWPIANSADSARAQLHTHTPPGYLLVDSGSTSKRKHAQLRGDPPTARSRHRHQRANGKHDPTNANANSERVPSSPLPFPTRQCCEKAAPLAQGPEADPAKNETHLVVDPERGQRQAYRACQRQTRPPAIAPASPIPRSRCSQRYRLLRQLESRKRVDAALETKVWEAQNQGWRGTQGRRKRLRSWRGCWCGSRALFLVRSQVGRRGSGDTKSAKRGIKNAVIFELSQVKPDGEKEYGRRCCWSSRKRVGGDLGMRVCEARNQDQRRAGERKSETDLVHSPGDER